MTRIGLIAALAVVSAASAYAQMRPVDPPVTRSLPESRVDPPGQLTETVPQLVQNVRRHARDADARRCLELPTNRQVHRCAERYRSRASRSAAVVKTSPKLAAPAQASEMVRPPIDAPRSKGAPKAGDLEKAADLVKPMDVTRPGGTPKVVESAPKAAEPAKGAAPLAPAAKAPAADTTKATAPAKAPEPAKK